VSQETINNLGDQITLWVVINQSIQQNGIGTAVRTTAGMIDRIFR
jgi:hypothetical protein